MTMQHIHPLKEYKRQLIVRLIDNGETDESIAALAEYSVKWIRHLRLLYEKEGDKVLILQKPGGSVCRLDESDLSALRGILDKGSESYGLEGAFWDRKRVKYVIKQEFNVDYDIEHISDILAKINYTLQKPRKKDFRQNETKVAVWTEQTLPEIKKK
jgi:transposase